ncbi:MAG: Flp pilus assembly protein CpaB [Coriobacteriia bacterium]|nr:Flp pilus assembly protein CpaB [Coriobacteriia bacterium]
MEKKMIGIALVCGLLCAACLFGYVMLLQRQAEAERLQVLDQYGGEQVSVLVATCDIQPGETLDSSNSKEELWVSKLLPEGSITEASEGWGKKTKSLILAGEVVSSKRFEGDSSVIEIPEGFVAVSVPAKDVQAVGGLVAPGNKVDVYAVGTKTSCLGEDVLVLDTSAKSVDEQTQAKVEWVTLAVLPENAQDYIAASEALEIYFTLPASAKEVSAGETSAGKSSEDESKDVSEVKDSSNGAKDGKEEADDKESADEGGVESAKGSSADKGGTGDKGNSGDKQS